MATAPKAAGIMDLPENEDMNQAPQLSPMESYDAVTTALNTASPDAAAQYEQTMNMSLPPELMEMSAEEIGQLLQLFQYLQENPEEYPAAIAELIKDGIIDEGDLPPEYDDEVLATVSALLMQALKTKQGAMPQQPQGFAMGGIADAARIVANQGRGQDTMLAHITPEEAQLLRSRGGMGTINPMTGLREFGFFKKIFRGVTKVVKAVVKPIVKAAKEIVKSPIGRIVATIALTTALGPIGLSYGATSALASAGITALSGGNLKDILVSSATAYFGAPGSPVGDFVGKLGITSVGAQAAAASGLVGAGASLLQGKSLKDSVKAGITQAAIGAGTTIARNYLSQPPGTRSLDAAVKNVFTPADALGDQIDGKVYGPSDKPLTVDDVLSGEQAEVVNMSTPGSGPAPITTAADVMPQTPDISQYDGWGAAYDGPKNLSSPTSGAAPVVTASSMPTDYNISQFDGYGAALDGPKNLSSPGGGAAPVTPAAGVMPQAPAAMTPNMTPNAMGGQVPSSGGIGSLVDGAKNIYGEYFDPSRGAGAGQSAFDSAYDKAMATKRGETYALEMARGAREAATPGIISQYGPLAAAGIGTMAMMGGFKPPETPASELQKKLSGTPGADLIEADPSKYVIGNLPGVKYDERGNIVGSTPYSPPQTMADIRVPAANTTPGQNMMSSYTPPPYSPTAGGGQSIFQPYNTSSMYANLMGTPIQPRYAAQGGMMSGGIANLSGGGYPRRTGQIEGPGTEKSDSIPAMLSDGEFVMTAGAVRGAGNGSRRAGAKKMYALMHQLEQNAARG